MRIALRSQTVRSIPSVRNPEGALVPPDSFFKIFEVEKKLRNSFEAALFLCISHSLLMKKCMRKEIRYYKVGRRNVFLEEDLLAYIERNKVPTKEELQHAAETQLSNIKNNNKR